MTVSTEEPAEIAGCMWKRKKECEGRRGICWKLFNWERLKEGDVYIQADRILVNIKEPGVVNAIAGWIVILKRLRKHYMVMIFVISWNLEFRNWLRESLQVVLGLRNKPCDTNNGTFRWFEEFMSLRNEKAENEKKISK